MEPVLPGFRDIFFVLVALDRYHRDYIPCCSQCRSEDPDQWELQWHGYIDGSVVITVPGHSSHLQVAEEFRKPAGHFWLPLLVLAAWHWRSWHWHKHFFGWNHRITLLLLKQWAWIEMGWHVCCAGHCWSQCSGQFAASHCARWCWHLRHWKSIHNGWPCYHIRWPTTGSCWYH